MVGDQLARSFLARSWRVLRSGTGGASFMLSEKHLHGHPVAYARHHRHHRRRCFSAHVRRAARLLPDSRLNATLQVLSRLHPRQRLARVRRIELHGQSMHTRALAEQPPRDLAQKVVDVIAVLV